MSNLLPGIKLCIVLPRADPHRPYSREGDEHIYVVAQRELGGEAGR